MKNNLISFVIGFLLCLIALTCCESNDLKYKEVTKIKTVKVTDTLKVKGAITTKYKKVYVRKTDTSIVYVDKADTSSVEARKYSQEIQGKRMKGVVHITTTGELLDVCTDIETKDSIIERTITKYNNKSKLFLSGKYNTNNSAEVGIDWNIKNKALIKGGVGYQIRNNTPYISVGIGIPIF